MDLDQIELIKNEGGAEKTQFFEDGKSEATALLKDAMDTVTKLRAMQ